MTRADAARAALVIGPAALAYVLVLVRRPTRPVLAGVLVSLAWNVPAVLLVNLLALRLGWWSFAPELPSFMGVAVEPWLGWVVLWGAVAPLAAWDRPAGVVVVAFVWSDLLAMPLLGPWLVLDASWPVGEAVAVALGLVPAVLLARWTARGEHLPRRVALQVVAAGGLLFWVIPSLAVEASGGWAAALAMPGWQLSLGAQVLALPAAVGVRAVIEFAHAGGGTPVPYDPPERLVRTGPYAYVANPMQASIVVALAGGAALLGNALLAGGAVIAFVYGAGLADWHENLQLGHRYGEAWTAYRARVRAWIPRARPAVFEEATLLVAFSCGTCSAVGRWFAVRRPAGLMISPAEEEPDDPGLRRITYVAGSGRRYRGVAAVARALEHIHLGWALAGWVLALPGVVHVAQLISDVCAPGPQRVAGLPFDPAACQTPSRSGRNG